jgi:hypothetical protein
MSYKDLLVVLDSEAAARGRIDLAATLAERFSAHLVGLYPLPVPQRPRDLGYYDPALLDPFFRDLRERAREAADTVREQFEHVANLTSAVFRRSGGSFPRVRTPIRPSMPATSI